MSSDLLFSIANTTALAAWLLIAVLPGRRWAVDLVAGRVVPAVFAALYVVIVAAMIGRTDGGFSTLGGVAALFAEPWLLLAGWLHYLAFDVLVGVWEVTDARARGVPHLLVLPCLALTFLFGPAGWLLYLGARQVRSARSEVDRRSEARM